MEGLSRQPLGIETHPREFHRESSERSSLSLSLLRIHDNARMLFASPEIHGGPVAFLYITRIYSKLRQRLYDGVRPTSRPRRLRALVHRARSGDKRSPREPRAPIECDNRYDDDTIKNCSWRWIINSLTSTLKGYTRDLSNYPFQFKILQRDPEKLTSTS